MSSTAGRDRILEYFDVVVQQLQHLARHEADSVRQAAGRIADTVMDGGLVYTFGSGHSRFIAGELTWRAGGLAPVVAIEDPSHGAAERLEGYAATFLEEYDIQARDVVIVISNSGINPVPIETAAHASRCGAFVIAVMSLTHGRATASRHSSGTKLDDHCDLVIDTHAPVGDAALELDGRQWRVAPTSTVLGTAVLNALVAEAAQRLIDAGHEPPVLQSANVAEGDDHNRRLADALWPRLTRFPRRGSSSAA